MRLVLSVLATATAAVALFGCSSSNQSTTSSGPTAQQVVDAFASAGLPVPNPRDNSKNCTGADGLGCTQLITTDAISVYTWPDEASAQHLADAYGDGAHREGLVVLSYAGAPTPEQDRPHYEAVLTDLLAQSSAASG